MKGSRQEIQIQSIMTRNVNATQLEQALSDYLESGRKAPLFIASYTGMGKTEIVGHVLENRKLINSGLIGFAGYRPVDPENWKVCWFGITTSSDIELIIKERHLLPTIVEVSLPNADFELETNPIWDQYENQEWLLYRPTFEEWLNWAEQKTNYGTPNVNPQIMDFIRWAGEKVLYDSILCGSYDRELGILNDAQLWPDKNYRYEGVELTKASEEKKKELSKQLNSLGKDEIGYPLDPRKNRFIHYNPRTWKRISEEFDNSLIDIHTEKKQPLFNNIVVGTRSELSCPSIMFKEYLQRPKES